MADYLPTFKPGQAITLKASATITGGQLVEVTGSGTVGPAGAASTKVVGVAGFDAATNDNVVIYSDGVQHLTASGAITAGDIVQAAAAGQIATGSVAPLGIALNTAANGADVRVQFTR
jgi:hypothetical protein